jgi:hypothetical protein
MEERQPGVGGVGGSVRRSVLPRRTAGPEIRKRLEPMRRKGRAWKRLGNAFHFLQRLIPRFSCLARSSHRVSPHKGIADAPISRISIRAASCFNRISGGGFADLICTLWDAAQTFAPAARYWGFPWMKMFENSGSFRAHGRIDPVSCMRLISQEEYNNRLSEIQRQFTFPAVQMNDSPSAGHALSSRL